MPFANFFNYPGTEEAHVPSAMHLLPNWSEKSWTRLLSLTETLRFDAGTEVIQPDDTSRHLYIVGKGTLEVLINRRGRQERLALVEAGSIFGEQSFFDQQPRSALVRSQTSCELLLLNYDRFQQFAAHEPRLAMELVLDLARIISMRLRQTTQLLTGHSL
jgi:CRP-like cAMP-binding protein